MTRRNLIIIAIVLIFLFVLIVVAKDNSVSFTLNAENATKHQEEKKEEKDPLLQKLKNPPEVVKAIYATAFSAGNSERVDGFIDLINSTELNAIVIDIKDYTGVVSYKPDVEAVVEYEAFENRIPDIDALIRKFHKNGIYLIARISTFQDNKLANARQDLAIQSKSKGGIWGDRKDVHWMDTSSKEVWDYNIAIAKDILDRGFDEVNFDYIRFATDGNTDDIAYPFYDEVTPKRDILKSFFKYVRESLPNAMISADLFGEVAYARRDIGIGQVLEDAMPYINAIAPMTYPSHYADGFIGYDNPAEYPYEVMKYSIDEALARLNLVYTPTPSTPETATASATPQVPAQVRSFPVQPTMRPWIQDFDLGADYDAAKVRAQIQAIEDSAAKYSDCQTLTEKRACSKYVSGWMLWNASNRYTKEALRSHEDES
ncbi:MAG: putative glycoside hydrolase [Candidatus Paceibacterota bacterium]